ncbi:unnamed protein product [Penicillium salamii]|uniref:CheY-like superfamily n=1 Tax=Penicillium salamii TaxID=1612424 RepID=A0A9W4JFU8_9EURO|nr:unnamed protein product [Penicillium salamii]CAG8315602.1 unnamed protein product [Penicillium salamii]CAG8389669.1 unnamed protein product [Penicillium salamii]CAG8391284.1 unnamed protein product [Penicillium salamii]CAG8394422.1 unnamed protein product [Penicillium salamii]
MQCQNRSLHSRHRSTLYLPPYHPNTQVLQHFGPITPSTEHVARSSLDPVLTAFAQLGTLRLNAQRALISLFGPDEQHVLTEATRTLSLQDDAHHNTRDRLWVGSCTLSYERSMCKAVMDSTLTTPDPRDRAFVVPDLTMDDILKNHPDVTEYPNVRFLASSPIVSPKGIVIGAYTILDDQPHDPLDGEILKFLVDISSTVMDYLATTRSKEQNIRSERMLVGLGSFLEGKGSLRNSWLVDNDGYGHLLQNSNRTEGHVDSNQQRIQLSHNATSAMLRNPPPSHLPFRPYNLHIPERKGSHASTEKVDKPQGVDTSLRDAEVQSKFRRASQAAITNSGEKSAQLSPKENYTAQLKETFSRASNMIRESIEVEAVVFFDANFASKGALLNDTKSDPETSCSPESCSSGDDDSRSREPQHHEPVDPELAEHSGKSALNPCEILGFATSNASSINCQATGDNKIALSEGFLSSLLRRYPRGKIFNYGADGSVFSDDSSGGNFKKFFRRTGGKKYKKTRKSRMRQDARALLQISPESRSIIFTPLWDSHKGRWYAGSLTWTRAAHRVFTPDDELAFLLTFGNSIMAEVHRLGAHFADRAKSDMLAGLSHELRSPLHGIFGTSELLGDTVLDTLQRGFIHTISSCAFTLLGSINQLLEYASINDVRPSSVVKTPGGGINALKGGSNSTVRRFSHSGKVDVDTCVELDSAVEDAIETVFAGYSFVDNSRSSLRRFVGYPTLNGDSLDTKGPVKVVLDIDGSENWRFSTRPGAWHVIITNIFGNALKFTRQGHVYVSMKATPAECTDEGQVLRSNITIIIKDTGCGIDSEYLNNGLFTAFSQQDSMTTGNGLGLNICRRILKSLGGNIQVNSQENIGTEVVATVALDRAFGWEDPSQADGQFSIVNVKELTQTKCIGILGDEASVLDKTLHTSLQNVCRDFLGMKTCLILPSEAQLTYCDFYISLHEHLDIGNLRIQAIAPASKEKLSSPLIIICSSPKVAHAMSAESRKRKDPAVLEFISQPCGPRKLAKTLETCIRRQQERLDSLSGEEVPGLPSTSSTAGSDEHKTDSHISSSLISDREPSIGATDYRARTSRRSRSISPGSSGDTHSPRAMSKNGTSMEADQPQTHDKEAICDVLQPRKVVLLVDDNEINLRLLIAVMKRLKCDYLIAQDGFEALEVFKSNFSDICMVFMDISMPIMDGLESTRRIREFEKTAGVQSRVTIAAITGLAQADVQRDAIGSGMDLFLTKPVRLDNLVPIIKGVLPRSHAIWQ